MATEDDVRRIVRALPETSEVLSAGVPYFRVLRHGFAKLRHDPYALVVWVAGESEKEELLRAAPQKFFSTPHYDGQAAVLVRLDAVNEDELTALITESWRLKAPDELLRHFGQTTNIITQ